MAQDRAQGSGARACASCPWHWLCQNKEGFCSILNGCFCFILDGQLCLSWDPHKPGSSLGSQLLCVGMDSWEEQLFAAMLQPRELVMVSVSPWNPGELQGGWSGVSAQAGLPWAACCFMNASTNPNPASPARTLLGVMGTVIHGRDLDLLMPGTKIPLDKMVVC